MGQQWGRLLLLYTHMCLEPDGTIRLPVAARVRVAKSCVLAPSIDGGIEVFSDALWKDVCQRRLGMPQIRYEARLLFERSRQEAVRRDLSPDGKLHISPSLQHIAGIEDEVLPVAAEDHLELWNPNRWLTRHTSRGLNGRTHEFA